MILGIDPGKGGGAAVMSESGLLIDCEAFRAPERMHEVLRGWEKTYHFSTVVIENVHAFPGQGVVSAFSFGQNFGWWEGRLSGYRLTYVEPRVWQKKLGIVLPGHSKKTEHKKALCAHAKLLFPGAKKVSLATCDAILIAFTAS